MTRHGTEQCVEWKFSVKVLWVCRKFPMSHNEHRNWDGTQSITMFPDTEKCCDWFFPLFCVLPSSEDRFEASQLLLLLIQPHWKKTNSKNLKLCAVGRFSSPTCCSSFFIHSQQLCQHSKKKAEGSRFFNYISTCSRSHSLPFSKSTFDILFASRWQRNQTYEQDFCPLFGCGTTGRGRWVRWR